MSVDTLSQILSQLKRIADAVDQGGVIEPEDWGLASAYRVQHRGQAKPRLMPVPNVKTTDLTQLQNISKQAGKVIQNTEQFLNGLPANHVLLTGARGTGKSSLIRALLSQYQKKGLRLIEFSKPCLLYLQEIIALLHTRPEKYILFCDDLSFSDSEPEYKALKSVLDGSIATFSDNTLIYATSNRRHLVPQLMQENLQSSVRETGEVDPSETSEEKLSLSDRFGLWVSFHPFTQNEYLSTVKAWFDYYNISFTDEARKHSLQWVIQRGNRSGRLALQFTKFWLSQ